MSRVSGRPCSSQRAQNRWARGRKSSQRAGAWMGRYLIKTEIRVFEAQNSAQLARLAKMGLISRDALVKELPDGEWVRASSHPDIGRLYREQDTDRTVIAALPPSADGSSAPREKTGVFWVRTDVSTVEVRGLEVLQRLYELGVVR